MGTLAIVCVELFGVMSEYVAGSLSQRRTSWTPHRPLLNESCRHGFCFHVRAATCQGYFGPSRPPQGLDTFGIIIKKEMPDKMPGGSQRCLSAPWHSRSACRNMQHGKYLRVLWRAILTGLFETHVQGHRTLVVSERSRP